MSVYRIGDRVKIKKTNSLFFEAAGMKGKISEIDEEFDLYTIYLDGRIVPVTLLSVEFKKI